MQSISEQVLVFNAGFVMLMDGLYKITDFKNVENTITAIIILDASHNIFKGHYPNQPVLPGACILQMVKDTLELALNKKLALKKASQMKFLAMVDPREHHQLALKLNISGVNDELKAVGNLVVGDKVCFKFQGMFKQV